MFPPWQEPLHRAQTLFRRTSPTGGAHDCAVLLRRASEIQGICRRTSDLRRCQCPLSALSPQRRRQSRRAIVSSFARHCWCRLATGTAPPCQHLGVFLARVAGAHRRTCAARACGRWWARTAAQSDQTGAAIHRLCQCTADGDDLHGARERWEGGFRPHTLRGEATVQHGSKRVVAKHIMCVLDAENTVRQLHGDGNDASEAS